MTEFIYKQFTSNKRNRQKSFAVLVDPDKLEDENSIKRLVLLAETAQVDYFFVGGSLIVNDVLEESVVKFKSYTQIPVVLFPGSPAQVCKYADALLYLSLISGRNPELLIGQHVISAPLVKKSGLEIIPTGYLVIDGGKPTAVSYISNATPIPNDKNDIAMCTALAGEMLGLKVIYMDAGSGAQFPISTSMIKKVAHNIEIPLIIGGGIRDSQAAEAACKAGADIIVVGNAIEKNPELISSIADAVHKCSAKELS